MKDVKYNKTPELFIKKVVSDRALCRSCNQYIKPFTEEWARTAFVGFEVYGCYSGYCRECLEDYFEREFGVREEEYKPHLLTPEMFEKGDFAWQLKYDIRSEDYRVWKLGEGDLKNEMWTAHDQKLADANSAYSCREGYIAQHRASQAKEA